MRVTTAHLLCLAILTFNWTTTKSFECEKENLNGPFKLKSPKYQSTQVEVNKASALLTEYPATVEALITYRFRYTAHCFTNMLGKQECDIKLTSAHPSKEEALYWEEKKTCMVGETCLPVSDCWGSWASKCLEKNPEMTTPGGPSFKYKGVPSPIQLYHQCTQDWKCAFKRTQLPIHITADHHSTLLWTSDETGKDIPLDSHTMDVGYLKDEEYLIHFMGAMRSPVVSTVQATCFSSSLDRIMCSIPHNSTSRNEQVVFKMDSNTLRGIMRNMNLQLLEPIEAVDQQQVVTLKPKSNAAGEWNTTKELNKSPNLEDMIEHLNLLKVLQMQSLYNTRELAISISDLADMNTKMIGSISKIDDHLIPNLLGISSRTTWINDHFFFLHPCKRHMLNLFGNCYSGWVYKSGRENKIEDPLECHSINPDSVTPLNLLEDLNLEGTSFTMKDPEVSSNFWDGWTWFAETGRQTHEFSETTGKGQDEDYLNQVSSMFWSLNSIYQGFLAFSSIVGWIALILHFIRR